MTLRSPKGRQATKLAKTYLHPGDSVTLEPGDHGFKTDRYRRTLAYIRMSDGKDFGLSMIMSGLCQDYGWKYPHPRMELYRVAVSNL